VPNSSLPVDIYGPDTDTASEDEANPYRNNRQRFLNSGVAIGTIGSMKKLFDEALTRALHDPNFGSDQQIFSEIFGEQEVYREILRRDTEGTASEDRMRLFKNEHIELVRSRLRSLEFGLGVDYESGIGLSTVFAEDDTAWLNHTNKEQLIEANRALGINMSESRVGKVQDDIASTLPPFWPATKEELPGDMTWNDAALLTNIWTGIAPIVIHHNAHRDGLKSRRETWWEEIWFQQHARVLYDAQVRTPSELLAVAGYNTSRAWWASDHRKGGAQDASGQWLTHDDICRGTEDEVFRDGKGPWVHPDNR